jgi:hypothetical protein
MAAVGIDAPALVLVEGRAVQQLRQQQLRVYARGDRARVEFPPILRDHASGDVALDEDPGDGSIGLDLHTEPARRRGDGIGDGAHAAAGDTPGAGLALHLAERMVQQYVGGAGLVGVGKVADDPLEAQQPLEGYALEPGIEVVAEGTGHQLREYDLVFRIELAQPVAAAQEREEVVPTAAEVRWRLHGQTAQRRRHSADLVFEGVDTRGVAAGETRDFAARLCAVAGELQVAVG